VHARVSDRAGSSGCSRWRTRPCCLPPAELRRHPNFVDFAAQWLACTLPYRRFDATLAGDAARLRADVGRYPFIAVNLHHILLAGLPAHSASHQVRP